MAPVDHQSLTAFLNQEDKKLQLVAQLKVQKTYIKRLDELSEKNFAEGKWKKKDTTKDIINSKGTTGKNPTPLIAEVSSFMRVFMPVRIVMKRLQKEIDEIPNNYENTNSNVQRYLDSTNQVRTYLATYLAIFRSSSTFTNPVCCSFCSNSNQLTRRRPSMKAVQSGRHWQRKRHPAVARIPTTSTTLQRPPQSSSKVYGIGWANLHPNTAPRK